MCNSLCEIEREGACVRVEGRNQNGNFPGTYVTE